MEWALATYRPIKLGPVASTVFFALFALLVIGASIALTATLPCSSEAAFGLGGWRHHRPIATAPVGAPGK